MYATTTRPNIIPFNMDDIVVDEFARMECITPDVAPWLFKDVYRCTMCGYITLAPLNCRDSGFIVRCGPCLYATEQARIWYRLRAWHAYMQALAFFRDTNKCFVDAYVVGPEILFRAQLPKRRLSFRVEALVLGALRCKDMFTLSWISE